MIKTNRSPFTHNAIQLIMSLVFIVSSGPVMCEVEINGIQANWCLQCLQTGNC